MDARNVRILKPYTDVTCEDDTIYIDENARYALHEPWGTEVVLVGRRKCKAKIAPLKEEDANAQVCRMNEQLMDKVYCTVGEEVLIYDSSH